MSRALNEFNIRLDELRNDLRLLEFTFELRPRIHQVLNHENRGDVLDLARRFASVLGNRPASFYGPMLVRLVASFERYLRVLMGEIIETWTKTARTFDELPSSLGSRNLVLSGRLIGSSDTPRDHINIDLDTLVDNLATCRNGSTSFRLNSPVFMALITGVTPEVFEKGLETAQITNWWNVVGADQALKDQLNTRRTVDTRKLAEAKLRELSKWRNNWAHGGDDEVTLTGEEVVSALKFLSAFSSALDAAVTRQLAARRQRS